MLFLKKKKSINLLRTWFTIGVSIDLQVFFVVFFLQQKHLFKIQKHKQILYNLFSAVLIGCDWHIKTCQWYQNAFYSIYSKPKVKGEGQERLWAAHQTNQRQVRKSLQNLPGCWAWFSHMVNIPKCPQYNHSMNAF